MAAAGVVAFKLIVNLCRCTECLFQTIRSYQRRRTVHFIEVTDFLRNRNISGVIIQFLRYQFLTENAAHFFGGQRSAGAGIQQRRRFNGHIRPDIVPAVRNLRFIQIDFVGNFCFAHGNTLLFHIDFSIDRLRSTASSGQIQSRHRLVSSFIRTPPEKQKTCPNIPKMPGQENSCGATQL